MAIESLPLMSGVIGSRVSSSFRPSTACVRRALAGLHIRTRRFNAWLYWATIITSTTAGTTLADFATRSLGIGYPGGSLLLLGCVIGSLLVWYRMLGSVAVDSIVGPREEIFY